MRMDGWQDNPLPSHFMFQLTVYSQCTHNSRDG